MRKPVFGVSDQVRLKPACSAIETSSSLESLDIASIDIILSRQRTTQSLIRLWDVQSDLSLCCSSMA